MAAEGFQWTPIDGELAMAPAAQEVPAAQPVRDAPADEPPEEELTPRSWGFRAALGGIKTIAKKGLEKGGNVVSATTEKVTNSQLVQKVGDKTMNIASAAVSKIGYGAPLCWVAVTLP